MKIIGIVKNFLKKEEELRNKVIKELSIQIINSPNFLIYFKNSNLVISLTSDTGDLYIIYPDKKFDYNEQILKVINGKYEIYNPRKSLLPWENSKQILSNFIPLVTLRELDGDEFKFTREYKRLYIQFYKDINYVNIDSINPNLTEKEKLNPIYLSEALIKKLRNE